MDPQDQEVHELLRESEAKLLESSRKELESTIKLSLSDRLLRRFNNDFWYNNNGFERNWIAMKEADIIALFKSSITNGHNCITAFQVFDFNEENKSNNPIVSQETIEKIRSDFKDKITGICTEAIRRQNGLPETKGFNSFISHIGKNDLIIAGGVIVSATGIACTAAFWAPIAAFLGAYALSETAILGVAVYANCVWTTTTATIVAEMTKK
jgi:hypothetical protein